MQAAAVKRISILGITLLIVLVPFGGYYLSYVSSQRAYYRTKNFRVLNAIAKQIASRLKGISQNVQNAADKAASDLREQSEKCRVPFANRSKTAAGRALIMKVLEAKLP